MATRNNDFPDSKSHHASYPKFLSLPETLKLHLSFMIRGARDACRWDLTFKTIYGDAEIRSQVFKSLTLNILSLSSLYVFDYLLLPLAKGRKSYPYINWTYRIFWLFPLVAVSLYLNGTWADVVARRSFTLQHGMRIVSSPSTYRGIMAALASSAYRIAMIITSFTLTRSLSSTPRIGLVLGTLVACWVNAYYCFEFTWTARGLTLAQRVNIVEERWAYFLAFGLFTAIPCSFFPGLGGTVLFALQLPFFIIKANHATPVPKYPYSPSVDDYISRSTSQSIPLYPSPFVPIRVPIFSLVLAIDNFVISLINIATLGRTRISRIKLSRQKTPNQPDVVGKFEEGYADAILDSTLNTRRRK